MTWCLRKPSKLRVHAFFCDYDYLPDDVFITQRITVWLSSCSKSLGGKRIAISSLGVPAAQLGIPNSMGLAVHHIGCKAAGERPAGHLGLGIVAHQLSTMHL